MKHAQADTSSFDIPLLRSAFAQSFVRLDPRALWHNPVLFVTAIAAALASLSWVLSLAGEGPVAPALAGQIALWLWLTVLFATFAEALAEGRGKARADALRSTQAQATARRLVRGDDSGDLARAGLETVAASALRAGDIVRVQAGEMIPADGEIIRGIASVDESAITGESAPVIRESGGDRSGVTGGTRVVSDSIDVRVTAEPGQSYLDRLIALVEGARRQKTPNEIALSLVLSALTLLFVIVVAGLQGFASHAGVVIPLVFLVALLITLIPTTIGGLLSAIGIAGMDRLVKANVIAKSGRAVEAAGDVDTLLLDKTGTITYGNRLAVAFLPAPGNTERDLASAAWLASSEDDTPEGRSIVALARGLGANEPPRANATFVPFTAQTRMSGADLEGESLRKGAVDAVLAWVRGLAQDHDDGPATIGDTPAAHGITATHDTATTRDIAAIRAIVDPISRAGGTPLLVARGTRVLGVVHLKDVVKPDIRERFAQLRAMGIRTVMITGDNPLTAAAIAAEAGVDDFLAEATPERKLAFIREEQSHGRLVAMCGDGSNDAPALAQADVGVAMNEGTAAAREAANLIDLDSNPTKLIEVVMVGKQLLISRGALTTFSIANDVAKYFAIIPAICVAAYPQLDALNVMRLQSASSAILAALIFNALVIVALIPLALRGVTWRAASANTLLARNLAIYGGGGLLVPFAGIKLIDLAINAVGMV